MSDKVYTNIIFIHDYENTEVKRLLNSLYLIDSGIEDTEEKLINYLSQWDYGDSADISSAPPWGSSDTLYSMDRGSSEDVYMLSYNLGLGYASLTIVQEG